jgi:hypothetical protein
VIANLAQRAWRRARALVPTDGYYFDRPLLLVQSDDWGRVGVRDREGIEVLRSAGLVLGENPYDLYSLETAEDLCHLRDTSLKHKDATGRSLCIGMNFVVHNLDFPRMEAENFRQIHLHPLSDGLPGAWTRPGLIQAYREGIGEGIFCPALHGSTHFCRSAVAAVLGESSERAELLRTLWRSGTPYIHWRMPWIGYEYWNPNLRENQFLPRENQLQLISASVGAFAKFFSTLPSSACAPGYRADANTHAVWASCGIRVAQNGPGTLSPPHVENDLVHTYRTVEFEPAIDPEFSVATCISQAEACFQKGIPAVVSMHAINLHSSITDFRSRTLAELDKFLNALKAKSSNLLYLADGDLCKLLQTGMYETAQGTIRVKVKRRKFWPAQTARIAVGVHETSRQ